MVDLKKEFRTLKLLSWALVIIGGGLVVGGFGIGLLTRDQPRVSSRERSAEQPEANGGEARPADTNFESVPPTAKARDPEKDREKLMSFTSQLSIRTGILGLVFLAIGGALRWIITNNIDEDDDEVQMSDELFKAYAAQLAKAAKQKEKERKRMK